MIFVTHYCHQGGYYWPLMASYRKIAVQCYSEAFAKLDKALKSDRYYPR